MTLLWILRPCTTPREHHHPDLRGGLPLQSRTNATWAHTCGSKKTCRQAKHARPAILGTLLSKREELCCQSPAPLNFISVLEHSIDCSIPEGVCFEVLIDILCEQAFSDTKDPSRLKITREQIADASRLPGVVRFTVRDGKMEALNGQYWSNTFIKMAEG